jgi:hypothetical protein
MLSFIWANVLTINQQNMYISRGPPFRAAFGIKAGDFFYYFRIFFSHPRSGAMIFNIFVIKLTQTSYFDSEYSNNHFLKRLPGVGEQTRVLLIFIYFLIFHHFTAEPQRLPYSNNHWDTGLQENAIVFVFKSNSQRMRRLCGRVPPVYKGLGVYT